MNPRHPHALVAVAGAVAGFAIWAAARMVFGTVEPWDVGIWYYSAAILATGLLSGLASPTARTALLAFSAVWIGQVAGIALLVPHSDPPWFPYGVLVTGFGSVPALLGAAVGALLRTLRHRHPPA